MKRISKATLAVIFVLMLFHPELNSQTRIAKSVIASGASAMSNSTQRLAGTIGQTIIGLTGNVSIKAGEGFWYQVIGSLPVSVEELPGTFPDAFNLKQNYPNPVSTSTTFEFTILKASHVTLEIYNMLGMKVKTLIDDEVNSGTHQLRWDNIDLPDGMYVYKLTAGEFSTLRKLLLFRK